MNLEKELLGEKRHLQYDKENDLYRAWILDAEVDPIEIEFDYDTITLKTEKVAYVMLTSHEIYQIESLHEKVKQMWDDQLDE